MTLSDRHSTPLESLLHAYANRFEAARAWQRNSGKVVGYISTAVPRELISAAGMLPLLITGDPHRGTALADEWMEEQFDPMARSIFDIALAGELEFLDLLIVPRVADSFLRLYLYLREVERIGAAKRLPRIVLFDLLQTRQYSSGTYNQERLQELRGTLETLRGSAIDDDELRTAIDTGNAGRRLLGEVAGLRTSVTAPVAGSLALQLIGAAHCLPTREHCDLLTRALAKGLPAASRQQGQQGARVVVAGNAQDHAGLYELLESQGFSIVGDYHWLGDADHRREISVTGDPWLALIDHYHSHALTSRRFPHRPQELLEYAQSVHADGAIFYLFEQEEALTWDAPGQVSALEQAGIATLVLDNQAYLPCSTSAALANLTAFGSKLRAAQAQP